MLQCTYISAQCWIYAYLAPCLRFFPALKCFSPAAGHTVVETLCLRKDSGTDVTAGSVPLQSSVGGFCSRLVLSSFFFLFCWRLFGLAVFL